MALPLTLSRMSPGEMRPDVCSHAQDFRACFTFAELHYRHTSTSSHSHHHVSFFSRRTSLPVLLFLHVGTDAQADIDPRRCNTTSNHLRKPTLLESPDHPIFPHRIALECEPQTRGRPSTCTRQRALRQSSTYPVSQNAVT